MLTKANVSLTTLDIGGHHKNRELLTATIGGASAIIFMVDTLDTQRFEEAASGLHALSVTKGLEGVPFLVPGNKIDCPGASTWLLGVF